MEFSNTLTFNSGDMEKEVVINILDDAEFEEMEFCLELVQPVDSYLYQLSLLRTNIYIEDNEGTSCS